MHADHLPAPSSANRSPALEPAMRWTMTSVSAEATLDEPITTTGPEVTTVATCDMCVHPLDDHDRVARRYCAATSANAMDRGCVCK